MAHLIDKSALVAEIERLACPEHGSLCDKLLEFLDTLEVKEVDLKQSYREYINNTYNEEFAQSILDNNIKGDLDNSDLFGIMSYGFELGLRASQPTTSVYGIEEALKENGIDPDSKEADMYREAIYKIYDRLQAQKGE